MLIVWLPIQNSNAHQTKNLTIFAERHLVPTLTNIARIYSQKGNAVVSVSFNSLNELSTNLDIGEPADVFILSNQETISSLKQKGLVDVYNVSYIAQDGLALVTSSDNLKIPEELTKEKLSLNDSLKILDKNHINLIVEERNTSLGEASFALLNSLNLNNIQVIFKMSDDKISTSKLINSAPENYAILFLSEVYQKKDFKILAKEKLKNVFYQALVIAGDNMEAAREFLKFLKTDEARLILKNNGFVVE
jgi:molybdate transport system substrate-binding protein